MSNTDLMIVSLAREVKDHTNVFVGVCSPIPLLAVELARRTHAPHANLVTCIGSVNPMMDGAAFSSELNQGRARISLSEVYDMAFKGRIDLTFFSGAQIDGEGNINMSAIGEYNNPKVRLPGGAGSPVLSNVVNQVVIFCPRHDTKRLNSLFFRTTVSSKPKRIVTNLCIFEVGKKIELVSIHPGVDMDEIRKNTGFPFRVPRDVQVTKKPTIKEKAMLDEIDYKGIREELY